MVASGTKANRTRVEHEPDQTVPRSIARTFDLLEAVAYIDSCNLTAAAQHTGLTPTTALRYLRALEHRGYVTRDNNGLFSPGPTWVRLAGSIPKANPLEQAIAVAQPYLDELSAKTGESAYLAVGDSKVATYVATAESDRAIRHVGWVGQEVPIKGSAVGAALRSPGKISVRVGAVEPDISAVSVGLNCNKSPHLALSVVGPQHRLNGKSLLHAEKAIVDIAERLSADLGLAYEPPSGSHPSDIEDTK